MRDAKIIVYEDRHQVLRDVQILRDKCGIFRKSGSNGADDGR